MSFRSVVIANPCYLQSINNQLQITRDGQKYTVALEDIACIILDHYAISLSATLLANCASYGIIIISCDKNHLPNGIFHSYLAHSRQNLVIQNQLNLSLPFKKKIWQQIIIQKITNQADCLLRLDLSIDVYENLSNIAKHVSSGDKNNSEAHASKIYFPALFGNDFIRITKNKPARDNPVDYEQINASLNFSYAIVRSLICRSLVGYGLLPTLGVFHDNQLNSFNLADDFIEPFRAFIDWYVYSKAMEFDCNDLTNLHRVELINILNHLVVIDNKSTTVLNACDVMIKSYISCIKNNDILALRLPKIPKQIQCCNMD